MKTKKRRKENILDDAERQLFLVAVTSDFDASFGRLYADKVLSGRTEQPKPKRKKNRIEATIDLHGMRRVQAIKRLESFINSCLISGQLNIKVIHGKGSGALKEEVYAYLARHPKVSRMMTPPPRDGGEGALVIWLKQV